MKRFSIIIALLLTISACERFTKPEPEPTITEKVTDYFDNYVESALNDMTVDDVGSIMALYSDDYLNNGLEKTDIKQSFLDYASQNNINNLTISFTIENEDSLKVSWSFNNSKNIPQIDYLIPDSTSKYKFYGNQVSSMQDMIYTFFEEEILPAIEQISESDVSSIMAFYCDDYLNNGSVKSDVEQEYIDFLSNGNVVQFSMHVTIVNEEQMKVSWSFCQTETMKRIDYLMENGDSFLFYGDQQQLPPTETTKAFIEVLTATWCPNCPELEHKIEEMKETYGNDLFYVEYHYNDNLSGDFSDIQSWYNIYSAPTGVLQGTNIFVGSESTTLNQYNNIISSITATNADIVLNNLEYTHEGDKYSFSIDIDNPGMVDTEDLYLRYLIVEDTSSSLNNAGNPCKNVMLEQNKIALSDVDFYGTYEFDHTLLNTLPEDAKIIIFVQTMPETFNESTCKIHNVMEADLN